MSERVDNRTTLSRRLKLAEDHAGMRPAELAAATGLEKSHICHLEKGRNTNPSLKTISAIAKALGVSIDYLAGLEDGDGRDRISLMAQADRRLSDEDARLASSFINMLASKDYADRFELARDFMDLLAESRS